MLVPFVAGVLVALAGDARPRLRTGLALASTGVVLAATAVAATQRLQLGRPVVFNYEVFGSGAKAALAVRLAAEPLGLVLAIVAASLWVLTIVYSIGYMAHEHSLTRYFAFLTAVEGAAMGIVYAADPLTFFVFYEVLTLTVYPLVVHEQTPKAIQSARVYLAYLLVGETLVFASVFIIWSVAGYVPAFAPGGLAQGIGLAGSAALAVAILGFVGFGAKAAVMPLHAWLPDAMIAPTPVSAVLHAVAVVKVGALGIMSLLYLVIGADLGRSLGLHDVLPWVASITILGGSLIALRQDEIKRRLAYSTVSQLGYIVLGASLLDRSGLRGAVLHMVAHSLMKIVLFFCAGIIITQAGKRYFSEFDGLAKRMPVTMACFSIAALGMVGLPPAIGWVSKWTLLEGVYSSGRYLLVAVILISALLNLGYYFPPIMAAYFMPGSPDDSKRRGPEAPLTMLVPTAAIAILVVVLGVWPRFPYWLADEAVRSVFGRMAGG